MEQFVEYMTVYEGIESKSRSLENALLEITCTVIEPVNDEMIKYDEITNDSTPFNDLLKLLLRSEHNYCTLALVMRAKRELNLQLDQFISERDICMNRLLLIVNQTKAARSAYRDVCKALRDCLLPSIHIASVLFDDCGDLKGVVRLFALKWILHAVTTLEQVLAESKDTLELNALWTQTLMLNRQLEKQGVAFLPAVEQLFIKRACELINVESCESDDEYIIALNACRYFAHPAVLDFLFTKIDCTENDLLSEATREKVQQFRRPGSSE